MAQESGYSIEVSSDGGTTWSPLADLAAGTTSYQHSVAAAGTTRHYRAKSKGNGSTTTDSDYTPVVSATSGAASYAMLSGVELILDFEGLVVGQDNAYGVVDAAGNVTKLRGIAPGPLREINLNGSGITLTAEGIVFPGTGTFRSTLLAEWAFLHQPNAKHTIHFAGRIGSTADPNTIYSILGTNGGTTGKTGFSWQYDDRAAQTKNESLVVSVSNTVNTGTASPYNAKGAEGAPKPNVMSVITQEIDLSRTTYDKGTLVHDGVVKVLSTGYYNGNESAGNPSHGLEIGGTGAGGSPLIGAIKYLVIQSTVESAQVRNDFHNWLKGRPGV